MAHLRKHTRTYLALNLTGDLAGVTYITKRGMKQIAYVKTYPARANTPAKQLATQRFAAACTAWRELDPAHQQALRDIERRFHLHTYGRNVFIGCHITGRLDIIEEWATQIGFVW